MTDRKKSRPDLVPLLQDEETEERNRDLYGMGAGLFGNDTGEEDIEQSSMNSYWKKNPKTGVGLTEPPERDAGAVGDITALLRRRPRASDAPGAIVPYKRRDEALFSIIQHYGKSLSESPQSVHALCGELLADIDTEKRFNLLRTRLESLGCRDLPTWTEAQAVKRELDEYYAGLLGVGTGTSWSIYPWDRPGAFAPTETRRDVPGLDFHIPKPSAKAPIKSLKRKLAGKRNARTPGVYGRLERARSTIDNEARRQAGEKNRDLYKGFRGKLRPKKKMQLAAGKYKDIDNGHVELKEGYPTVQGGFPWFHGKVDRRTVGGIPVIFVQEGHMIASGTLPRPKFTEGYNVWNCGCPLGAFDMEIAFAKLTEGMDSVRPWLKKSADKVVLGIPTEGVIVESRKDGMSFLTFDSQSGYSAMQEWMLSEYDESTARRVIEEAVTYGYVRSGKADLVLDRVMRKMNRLNILDVFEDAVFDKGAEALYILLNPTLEESEVQEIAIGLQSEYPEIRILGGPLDENTDWWVLYLPKPGQDYGPNLAGIFEPSIARPLDVTTPNIIKQAVRQVVG